VSSYLEIQLSQQPIELCKLLKIANMVGGGGEAKIVISEGYVVLNGEVEFQKRKKVYHNDVVEFNGEVIQVVINENLTEEGLAEEDSSIQEDHHQNRFNAKESRELSIKNESPQESTSKQRKRKPISF